MEEVTIYRIENDGGEGMYRPMSETGKFMDDDQERHPIPREDDGIRDTFEDLGSSLSYGFSSINQLKFWVYKREWRESLKEEGFHVVKLAAHGIYGDTQAAFLTETRKDIEIISLETI